jgi:hypothetical protein
MKLNMCWSLVVFDLTKACVQLFQPYEVNYTDVKYTQSFLFAWREFFSRQLNRPDILDWMLTVAHSSQNPLRDESEIMIVKYVELLKLAHYPVEFDSGKEEMDKYRALAMYNFTQYDRPIVGQWS